MPCLSIDEGATVNFGRLVCEPLSVREVIDNPELDNQHVAVHGVFYKGQGCLPDESFLLPKDGPFDGVEPMPMPKSIIRSACLLIEWPDYPGDLGKSGAAGLWYWKHNCIIVGQIRHRPGTEHPFRIGDLWIMLLQTWDNEGMGQGPPFHQLRMVLFSPPNPPELPWSGPAPKQRGDTVIRLYP
jgi:hypothetical protein